MKSGVKFDQRFLRVRVSAGRQAGNSLQYRNRRRHRQRCSAPVHLVIVQSGRAATYDSLRASSFNAILAFSQTLYGKLAGVFNFRQDCEQVCAQSPASITPINVQALPAPCTMAGALLTIGAPICPIGTRMHGCLSMSCSAVRTHGCWHRQTPVTQPLVCRSTRHYGVHTPPLGHTSASSKRVRQPCSVCMAAS